MSRPTPLIDAQELSLSFGPHDLFLKINFSIAQGERVGLVGHNGCGKSTLAKVLASMQPADGGEVALRRGATVGYLKQQPTFSEKQTAREALLASLGEWSDAMTDYDRIGLALAEPDADFDKLLSQQADAASVIERLGGWERSHLVDTVQEKLGIHSPDAEVTTMSGGERRRVALGQLLLQAPDLLILDEPTNHLDIDAIEWLEGYLRDEYAGAVLLITHDRYVLDHVAQRTFELDNAELFIYEGGWEAYLEAKADRMAHAASKESNRQNFLRTELEWLRRGPKARGTKAKARVERAHAAIDAKPKAARGGVTFTAEKVRMGKIVLSIKDLTLAVGEGDEHTVLAEDVQFLLQPGERIGIVGPNGCGKTTLLKTMLGKLLPAAGIVEMGQNTKVAYLDQSRSNLEQDKSVGDNISSGEGSVEFLGNRMDLRTYMAKFNFDAAELRKPLAGLSGGERARVALAKLLLSPLNLLVLDEPTNDLDVDTLGSLERMLIEANVTALIVTHDRYFLDRVATAVLGFLPEDDQSNIERFISYRHYRERMASLALEQTQAKEKPKPKAKPKSNAKAPGLSQKERKELANLPGDIDKVEKSLMACNESLALPEVYGDPKKLQETKDKAAKAEKALEALMSRWEELEAKSE